MSFYWVQDHISINRNTRANIATKVATCIPTCIQHVMPSDLISLAKNTLYLHWEKEWLDIDTHKLSKI